MHKPTIVIVLFSFVLLLSCKKDKPNPAPSYTAGLAGMRNWHGHHYYTASGPHFPTPRYEDWSLPDTSFAITVGTDNTATCMDVTYKYSSSDSVQQIHFFGLAKYYYTDGPGRGEGIAYYYALDSVVYLKNQDRHGTTDSWVLDNKYYTY